MNDTARDIARMLADRAESVCQYLYPNGKRNGAEYEIGSTSGEAGKSLKIRITGAKAGVWCDFASGIEKGDLINLWSFAKGVKLGQAIKEAKEFLGIKEPTFLPERKSYAKPSKEGVKKLSAISPVKAYLTQERLLSAESLAVYKVSEKGDFMVFPYLSPDGELLNLKSISIHRQDGKKIIHTEKDCAPCLFGWHALDEESRHVVICEGEIDAVTMYQYGVQALSVPFGAGKGNKNAWIDFEWENLQRFDVIYLCYDNDDAGRSSIAEVAERLGTHRCKVVTLPGKDVNECLQRGITGDKIAEAFMAAKAIQPAEICDAAHFADDVIDYFYPKDNQTGFRPELLSGAITFRPGELTIWTGVSSHGKSLMLGEIMLFAVAAGERCAIASMEMKPRQTLGRMMRQLWAKERPLQQEIRNALSALAGNLWVYDVLGNIPAKRLLELMKYSRCRHGVTQFVVDSLMKCGIHSDDYNAQREFMNDLVSFAREHNCHVHLVAHPRKGDSEREIVGKIEIKGSSDLFNQADNCLTVWRNKTKEEAARNGKKEHANEPDTVVFCDKQRETGWEGKIPLLFMKDSWQFIARPTFELKSEQPRSYRLFEKLDLREGVAESSTRVLEAEVIHEECSALL